MRINLNNSVSFQSGFVTTSRTALSPVVIRDIVEPFNEENRIIGDSNLSNSVNYFVLAGGHGSRMMPYVNTVYPVLGQQNKITLPFPIDKNTNLRVIDFPMYLGKPFLSREGYNTIEYTSPSGNFSDIIKFYLEYPSEVKDTLVCCGDNIYPLSCNELKETIAKAQRDRTDVLVFASKQMPENAANKFGVLKFSSFNMYDNNTLELDRFEDMSDIRTFYEQANHYMLPDGYCLSYPGMFFIKKEVMQWLLKQVKANPKIIEKIHPTTLTPCPEEQYDYIAALKLIRENMPCAKFLIKPVSGWKDIGKPEDYLKFLGSINAKSLQNFPEMKKIKILGALSNKVQLKKKKLVLADTNNSNHKLIAQYPLDGKKIGIYSDKRINFGSRVVKTDCPKGKKLTKKQLDFLDKFEEMPESKKNKYKIASGLTANIYYIKPFKFVIKSIKDITNKQLQKRLDASLKNEGANLKYFSGSKTKNVQQYLGLAQTEKGKLFLLTQYNAGKKIRKVSQLSSPVVLDNILQSLFMLDKHRIVNFDWNPNNILLDGSNSVLIDFQWAKKLQNFSSKVANVVSPEFETASNITAFETSTLAPFILKNKNKELLEKYLKIKSKYCKKEAWLMVQNNFKSLDKVKDKIEFELLRGKMFSKCSYSVLNVEMLRLEFLYNNLKRNFFLAPAIDKKKDAKFAEFYAKKAVLAAKAIADFDIPKHVSADEKAYLEKIKEMGKYYLEYLNSNA